MLSLSNLIQSLDKDDTHELSRLVYM